MLYIPATSYLRPEIQIDYTFQVHEPAARHGAGQKQT